jgi:formylglycine-generating enzyme
MVRRILNVVFMWVACHQIFLVQLRGEIVTNFGNGSNQFTMTFVPIGSPGNIGDLTGTPTPDQTNGKGVGAVSYSYAIGKYEISEAMIDSYNAANPGSVITKDVRGPNLPATDVTWNEAAGFVNWLNTSTGGSPAYKITSAGANSSLELWVPSDTLDFNPSNPFRSLRANFVLPDVNEWYKAAYYDPNLGSYFDYATGSNSAPFSVAAGSLPGTSVYGDQPMPTEIENAGGLSPFGTMAQSGNVWEWMETESDLANDDPEQFRIVRGGGWFNGPSFVSASFRDERVAIDGTSGIGFRVASLNLASIPEPSSLAFCLAGLLRMLGSRRRHSQSLLRSKGRS